MPAAAPGGVPSLTATDSPCRSEQTDGGSPLIKANFYIRADLHREIKYYALDNDLKIYQVLEMALERFLGSGSWRPR
jgi:hypothetical protein